MSKRIAKKYSSLFLWLHMWLSSRQFFCLCCMLLFVPLNIAAAQSSSQTLKEAALASANLASVTTASSKDSSGLASATLSELIYESSEHFSDIDSVNLHGLLERIGDARVVLLGEATHGTAEFYDMRARITRELIVNKGFNIVAVEADWPDAESINHYIHASGQNPFDSHYHNPVHHYKPFTGFPSWMWANHSVLAFTQWLKEYNRRFGSAETSVGFYGLDFYNIYSSINIVLDYLQDVDPKAAEAARRSYGCLMPWSSDPSLYSRAMQSKKIQAQKYRKNGHRHCGYPVRAVLQDIRKKREYYLHAVKQTDRRDGINNQRKLNEQRYLRAEQNAQLVKNGERFFRTMYYDNNDSWNQRDQSMFDTLLNIMNNRGKNSKAVIWAHNSHIGDARATSMKKHGEINLGQRVREKFGNSAYLIGFGTDHGTVAAASEWGAPMKVMQVQPSHQDSYERLCHEVKTDNFMLPLRITGQSTAVQVLTHEKLLTERLERAIGTTYDPENEIKKHYFNASLPRQFDEFIWFDETRAVKPLWQK